MFKNKINLSSIFVLCLSIWGCGTMAKNDDSLSVPQKVSVEMPKALAVNSSKSEKTFKRNKTESSKSSAYLALKDDVKFLEEQRIVLEVNLLFVNEVIATIDSKCKELAKEEVCVIEEDILTFVFDENLSSNLKVLTGEDFGYELGDVLTFGQVEFTEHSDASNHRYSLKMDTTFDDENITSFERISWSKDEKLILSEYVEESAETKNRIKIDFSIEDDGSRKVIVDDGFVSKVDGSSDTFHFDMLKKVDAFETYELNSSSVATDSDGDKNNFTSVGKLSNLGGNLNFTGKFLGEVFKENDTFDGNGNLLSAVYCYTGLDCELEDEGSWFAF